MVMLVLWLLRKPGNFTLSAFDLARLTHFQYLASLVIRLYLIEWYAPSQSGTNVSGLD